MTDLVVAVRDLAVNGFDQLRDWTPAAFRAPALRPVPLRPPLVMGKKGAEPV